MTVPDQPQPARRWSIDPASLRIASGLVLFTFAATHLLNHALGLVSVEWMQAGQDLRLAVTRSLPGTAVLLAAITVHFGFGLNKLVALRT
ncbi:MAG: hypothetical protein B7Z10_03040 [Rhodobacterales bacterium 32-66-7]|nr:MAG: hypothetical protein B7Z10_03040 [Rhodobacterales bacterium 32-66-7]